MNNLIKVILVYIFLICFISSAYGQTAVGAKGGLNYASYTNNKSNIREPILRYQYGLLFEFKMSERFSLQPEFLYIEKGIIQNFDLPPSSIQQLRRLFNYFELPILAKLKYGNQESTHFFITFGPSFGHALSGETVTRFIEDDEITFESSREFIFEDNSEDFSRFEMAFSVGAGVNIIAGPGKLFLEGRYSLGLTKSGYNGNYNAGPRVSLGYLFFIGK